MLTHQFHSILVSEKPKVKTFCEHWRSCIVVTCSDRNCNNRIDESIKKYPTQTSRVDEVLIERTSIVS